PWSTLAGAPSTPHWPDPARKQADPFILGELRLPFPSLLRAPSSLSSCPASASSRSSLCALKTSEPPPALTRCFEDEDAQRPVPELTPLHRLLPRLRPAPSLPSLRRSSRARPPQPRRGHVGTNKDTAAPWNLLCLELLSFRTHLRSTLPPSVSVVMSPDQRLCRTGHAPPRRPPKEQQQPCALPEPPPLRQAASPWPELHQPAATPLPATTSQAGASPPSLSCAPHPCSSAASTPLRVDQPPLLPDRLPGSASPCAS
uniref:Uncharacterized protein n=1 Tax=Triticum urartu TaxID=4572 RepID=A0A8R7TGS8_TRIUA